jgi:hypothetical protein
MDAESFKKAVHPLLKADGFKRSGATWRREQGESIAVLNIQKSQWGGGHYYVNLGAYFHALGDELSPTENKCHVRVRLDIEDPSRVVAAALEWFKARATLRSAASLAESDSKKGLVFRELRNIVTT